MDPLNQAIAWLALAQQLEHAGEGLWNDLKRVLDQHGVEADTETLDGIIADAARRKALAQADAAGPTANGD